MKACVFKINRRNGWIAVEPENNRQYYSIIDAHEVELEVGDAIEWDGRLAIGPGVMTITRSQKTVKVVFEDHNVDEKNVASRLKLDHE